MYRNTGFRGARLVIVAVWMMLGLVLSPASSLLAQAPAGNTGDTADSPDVEEDAQQVEEKDQYTPGEADPVDAGPAIGSERLYIPSVSGGTGSGEARVAAVDATIFTDSFCSFPNGWSRGGTPGAWIQQNIGVFCVARPDRYVNNMAIHMTRNFSTIGGNITGANATFRFRMNTETGFDFLRYEFSCNNRKTWRGGTTIADSGAYGGASPGFVTRTISLAPFCDESASVFLRFWFTTDNIVIGAERPALDSVTVTD